MNFFLIKKKIEDRVDKINSFLEPLMGKNCFSLCNNKIEDYGFKKDIVAGLSINKHEGALDPGKMIYTLKKKLGRSGVDFYFSTQVESFEENTKGVFLKLKSKSQTISIKTNKLAVCTNAFAKRWFNKESISPGRGLILITNRIPKLKINGCFHYNKGYYYFRNIDNRLLLGGGRDIDIKNETTYSFGTNKKIRQKLIDDLKTFILPNSDLNIENEWSGIMGFGKSKLPLIKRVSENISLGVRLGGMGISIGSIVGEKTAELVLGK